MNDLPYNISESLDEIGFTTVNSQKPGEISVVRKESILSISEEELITFESKEAFQEYVRDHANQE